ncbi:unnamed protein product, partial [Timema podura]|nr:unnamed protein product [Timema podura]
MEVKANSTPWPAVGKQKSTTYGGVSGNATRPVGLYAVSAIAKKIKDFPILGIGGIDSADTSLQFLQCGASAVQKLPHFGNYQELREEKISAIKKQSNLLAESQSPSPVRPCYQPNKPVPKVKDVVGRSLSKIGPYSNLDNKEQVVALIDDVSFVI